MVTWIYRQKPNDEIIIKYWWKPVNIHVWETFLLPSASTYPPQTRAFSFFSFRVGLRRGGLFCILSPVCPLESCGTKCSESRIHLYSSTFSRHTMNEIAIHVYLYLFGPANTTRQTEYPPPPCHRPGIPSYIDTKVILLCFAISNSHSAEWPL